MPVTFVTGVMRPGVIAFPGQGNARDQELMLLQQHGISCSLSGAGSCYDNAVVESFFASLKRERIERRKYRTRDQARADVFDYIERFYNRQRRHSYVGKISPATGCRPSNLSMP